VNGSAGFAVAPGHKGKGASSLMRGMFHSPGPASSRIVDLLASNTAVPT